MWESARVLLASTAEADWRSAGGREFHAAGAQLKKGTFFAIALLATVSQEAQWQKAATAGRLRETDVDDRV